MSFKDRLNQFLLESDIKATEHYPYGMDLYARTIANKS